MVSYQPAWLLLLAPYRVSGSCPRRRLSEARSAVSVVGGNGVYRCRCHPWVGGCCDLSTSVHHLVDKLGAELGYLMSKDTGYDVEDCITLATKGLKLRVARRVWRDYYRHSFARQHCADPSTEGLADQQRRRKISEEDSRRDEQERAKNHEFWAWKARNLSAWAPRGMG